MGVKAQVRGWLGGRGLTRDYGSCGLGVGLRLKLVRVEIGLGVVWSYGLKVFFMEVGIRINGSGWVRSEVWVKAGWRSG